MSPAAFSRQTGLVARAQDVNFLLNLVVNWIGVQTWGINLPLNIVGQLNWCFGHDVNFLVKFSGKNWVAACFYVLQLGCRWMCRQSFKVYRSRDIRWLRVRTAPWMPGISIKAFQGPLNLPESCSVPCIPWTSRNGWHVSWESRWFEKFTHFSRFIRAAVVHVVARMKSTSPVVLATDIPSSMFVCLFVCVFFFCYMHCCKTLATGESIVFFS